MEPGLVAKITRVRDAANDAVAAHLGRAESYVGLTLNEGYALSALRDEIAALLREAAFPHIETAA